MRTRFLGTDSSDQTLDFVRFPPPQFPTPVESSVHLCFDNVPVLVLPREDERLPMEDALSIFLSDVLPHKLDVFIETVHSEENKETTSDNNFEDELDFVQFEIPEMDVSLLPSESVACRQMECLQIISEVSDAECGRDLTDSEHALLPLHCHSEIHQLLCPLDSMPIEYSVEQTAELEDGGLVSGELSFDLKFPLFEVNEECPIVVCGVSTADKLLSFGDIDKQQVIQPDELTTEKNLMGFKAFDITEHLIHNHAASQCLEEAEVLSKLDCTDIIELSHCWEEYPMLPHGKQDIAPNLSPTIFDEILFTDMCPYHYYETLLGSMMETETQTCESMFAEAMNFKNFSELVVCHELTVVDDSFKSLPVPMFSDDGKTGSLHIMIEEILSHMDWQSASASDSLYLDWRLLQNDECGLGNYSDCQKLLFEIDLYNIDACIDFSDNGRLIIDFILSEEQYNKTDAENQTNLPCSDASLGEAALLKVTNLEERKRTNADLLLAATVDKAPVFGESMSSDLEYFLNPRKCVPGRENVVAEKSVKTTPLCPMVTSEIKKSKMEDQVNPPPVREMQVNAPLGAANEADDDTSAQSTQVGVEPNQKISCEGLYPSTIVVVNTRNFDEEMVISRRGTYQMILEMEKEGAQVVERDIGLPVDVIVSSAICLTWFDYKNIGKKSLAPEDACSCMPLCVESIATNVLTSLSYAFSCCILIFEGECNFLGNIMESSDELYAAATTLGIDIQLFCSYSPDMTEEIMLSCINSTAKSSRCIYPKMLESESLAESFLTSFPSINPLVAHAILSSDATLGHFLELSSEARLVTLRNFQVPDESIGLLSSVIKYGELEDSKSGMTDCSSSVSVPDSEKILLKNTASERKKPKYTHKFHEDVELPNDLFDICSLDDDQRNPPQSDIFAKSWFPKSAEISEGSEKFDLSFDDLLPSDNQELKSNKTKTSIKQLTLFDFPVIKDVRNSDEREKWISQIVTDCNPRLRPVTAVDNNLIGKSRKLSGTSQDKITGEVIDADDCSRFREEISPADLGSFSPFQHDFKRDYASRLSKRPLSVNDLPTFRNPTDVDFESGACDSRKVKSQISTKEKSHPNFKHRGCISIKSQQVLVGENLTEKAPRDFYQPSFREYGTRGVGGTPFSNALQHSQLQNGSPWTIEFLNRIKEKSSQRRQSLLHGLSSPGSGDTSKVTKRKSPSILESFKYQGESTPTKVARQSRPNRSFQRLSLLKNKKDTYSITTSWTPLDKRARQKLSFSTSGSGGQSRLAWIDNNTPVAHRRL